METNPSQYQVVVIGGGVTGLAVAYRLHELSSVNRLPLNIQLLESGDRLGGVIRTVERDGFLLEAGPDSFVNEKPWGLQLCERLGLADELIATNPHRRQSFVVRRGRLAAVPEGFYLLGPARLLPFLASPVCSPLGKLRAMVEYVVPRRSAMTDESIAAFVRRRFGREILERLAEPLISGMASGNVEQLSMQAVLPHVLEMEQRHGSIIKALRARQQAGASHAASAGARYGLFVSFHRGMQRLVDRLAERLPRASVRLRTRVVRIARDAGTRQWMVDLSDGQRMLTDAICVAIPPFRATGLVRTFDGHLAQLLEGPTYASWITINLAYRRADIRHSLAGFGFVVPAIERLPIVGCTFSHVKFAGRAPEGMTLLRAFVRTDDSAAGHELTDHDLERDARQTLSRLLGISAAPRFVAIHRFSRSLPQYHVGHLNWTATVQQGAQAHPGLALAGNAFGGHGVSHCIQSGEQAAEYLFESLTTWARNPRPGN